MRAEDASDSTKFSTVTVTISVSDVNDVTPSCTGGPTYTPYYINEEQNGNWEDTYWFNILFLEVFGFWSIYLVSQFLQKVILTSYQKIDGLLKLNSIVAIKQSRPIFALKTFVLKIAIKWSLHDTTTVSISFSNQLAWSFSETFDF